MIKTVEKEVKQEVKLLEKHSKLSLHYWTGHSFEWYLRVSLKPLIYLTIVNMVVTAFGTHATTSQVTSAVFIPLVFLAEIITYGWLGASVYIHSGTKTLPLGMRWATAMISGAITGLGVGLMMTFFRIFWYREFWTFLNIITEPAIRLIEGLVVAGLMAFLTAVALKYRR